MTAHVEAADLLRQVAGEPHYPVKAAIDRAMRRVEKFLPDYFRGNWHYGRVENIWQREARRIDTEEMDAIRAAANARLAQEARSEFQQLNSRIAKLEATVRLSHPDMDRAEADEVGRVARGEDRPVDRR